MLWLDAFTANVDRSWRNPNLLLWHGDLWVIDHGASLYFHHGWRSGVSDPAKFAAQPWDVGGHVFEECAHRARELDERDRGPARAATSSSRSWPRCPTSGSSPCPARRRPTRCARRTSTSSSPASAPASGCRRRRDDRRPARLPVRRAPLRAAARARGVRQRRRGAALPGRRLPRRRRGRSTPTASAPSTPTSTSTRCATRSPSSTGCAAATSAAGEAARQSLGQRFGFLKAPRSTVLQPGPVHGGLTGDPARQLEHLRERLVG